ncbi:MAG: hypothetical protein HQK66_02690 [Desulfamplus sp.]|nr:hypothetical protein [Desulfamplus sp.]
MEITYADKGTGILPLSINAVNLVNTVRITTMAAHRHNRSRDDSWIAPTDDFHIQPPWRHYRHMKIQATG